MNEGVSSDHFSGVAASYASCRPAYPDRLFDYLAGLVHRRRMVWDCGAGTGQATIPLASRFDTVIATDLSSSMLRLAPRHPRVKYLVARAEASGLPPATVDLVAVAQALHWFDLNAFYEEAARVLVPGGVLAVWTYGNPRFEKRDLQRKLNRFYNEVVGPYWPAERRHVEAGYRTLRFPFPELDPPPSLAMEEHWTLPQLLGYVGTWSATRRFRETEGWDPVPELGRALSLHWNSGVHRVRWPLEVRAGRRPLTAEAT